MPASLVHQGEVTNGRDFDVQTMMHPEIQCLTFPNWDVMIWMEVRAGAARMVVGMTRSVRSREVFHGSEDTFHASGSPTDEDLPLFCAVKEVS
jgi:hypothetical protein